MSGIGPLRPFEMCLMAARAEQSRGRVPSGASTAARAWPCGPRPLRCSVSRARRITRCAHCVRCARTHAASQITKRAARAARAPCAARRRRGAPPGTRPRLCGATPVLCVEGRRAAGVEPASRRAPQARVLASCRLDAGGSPSFAKRCRWLAKTRAGGGRSASAAPSSAGLAGSARSAPCEPTRRSCPSVESEANAASSATARKTEQRRGRGPQGHARAAAKRSTSPARGFARSNDGRPTVRNGPIADRHAGHSILFAAV